MNCNEARPLLHAYVDGEGDLDAALMIERHLEDCAACGRELAQLRALRSTLANQAVRYSAPPELARRINDLVSSATRPRTRLRLPQWFGAAGWGVAAAAAMVAMWIAVKANAPHPADLIAAEVVASHVRSLMPGHLTDVASTDQHTVKPWFDGKLDFSPEVADFATQGFSLVGGRLDYVAGRPIAALVYKRRKHLINLFEWPALGPHPPPGATTQNGYHVVHWERGGLSFWMVSNLNAAEMEQFVDLLKGQTS